MVTHTCPYVAVVFCRRSKQLLAWDLQGHTRIANFCFLLRLNYCTILLSLSDVIDTN